MKIIDIVEQAKPAGGQKKEKGIAERISSDQPAYQDKGLESAEEIYQIAPLNPDGWKALTEFETSVDFLLCFDEGLNLGKTILHPWQVEEPERICMAKPTGLKPYKYVLCAANGSGKDAFVIAPFALWFICCKIRSRVIITSSSGVQLTTQTEAYLSSMGQKVNAWAEKHLGAPILKIRKRHIICLLSGSEIILFATDEEGKAEGYHPIEPDCEMAIIVNEAKSVKPEIFRALRRCTGFNYFILVSTPGEPIGEFYKAFENWPNRRRITYYDCPHQSPDEFEADKKELGEHDPQFRSKWLALFTFIGGKNVVNQTALEKMRRRAKQGLISHVCKSYIGVGIDIALSAHGDETCINIVQGNKQKVQEVFRNQDATILADNIERTLNNNSISKEIYLNIDDGGVGRALIAILRKKGWKVNPILNNSAAKNKKRFRNRGAEMWEKLAKLIESQSLILLDDDKLYTQIASRKYRESDAGIDKLCLESKSEMKAEGLPSPDRADSLVLALNGLSIKEVLDKIEGPVEEAAKKVLISSEEQRNILEQAMWDGETKERKAQVKHSRFSLNVIFNRKH